MVQVDPVVMVINSSVVSLPFSDHNTQQTHTNNSNSDAEEDVQVQEQRLKLCVYLASSSIFAHFFERKGGLTLKKKNDNPEIGYISQESVCPHLSLEKSLYHSFYIH